MSSNSQPTTSSICGIDLGSHSCYIAIAKGGGIEILLNDYSQRATPSCVGLGDKQRDIGVSAFQKHAMNINNTFYAMKRLVGRQYQHVLQTENLLFPIKQSTQGEVAVDTHHNGEQMEFTGTQLQAMLCTKLREISGLAVDCVISCPSYFTEAQKRSLLDSCMISGLNPIRILPDLTAVGIYYGFYRVGKMNENSIVAFVDCGHTVTQCSVIHFNSKLNSMNVLSTEWESNLGGKHFDELLADYFIDKHKLNLNKRAKLRLTLECEKLKKQMSANSNDLPINIECLYDDRDFSSRMDRILFESLAEPHLKKIEGIFQRALENGAKTLAERQKNSENLEFKIDSVEVVGGAHRISAIKRIIKDVFGMEVSTTLNADEAVARGCALQCAMLSPSFKVAREMTIIDYSPFQISCKYWFESEAEGKITSLHNFFPRGSTIPSTRQITAICRSLPFILELEYSDIANPGHTYTIGQFKIYSTDPNLVLNKNKMKIRVRLDPNGLVSITSATLELDQEKEAGQVDDKNSKNAQPMETDGQEIPVNNADNQKESSEEKSNEQKKVVQKFELCVEELWLKGKLSEQELQYYKEVEANLILADKNWKERIDARNELEEYIYEWRNKMDEGKYDKFVSQPDKDTFGAELNRMEQWLYDETDVQSRSVYFEKMKQLQSKYSNSILFRERECLSRSDCIEHLGKNIQLGDKLLAESVNLVEEEKRKKLEVSLIEKRKWLEDCFNILSAAPTNVDPPITTEQIKQQINDLETYRRPVFDEYHKKMQELNKQEEEKKKQAQKQEQPKPQENPQEQEKMELDSQAQS